MVALEVRRLEPHEWEVLRHLRLEALRDAPGAFASTVAREVEFSADIWAQRTATSAIALLGDEPVGLVGWYRPDESRTQVELVSMWVRADARGMGAAALLVELVVTDAVEAPEDRVVLGVVVDNARARRFYERMGFVETGAEIGEHTGQALIRMAYAPPTLPGSPP